VKPIKFTILGAGSLKTLKVIRDIIRVFQPYNRVHVALMDINAEKAGTMMRLARLMQEFDPAVCKLSATDDFTRAADGADCIFCQFRLDMASEQWERRTCARYGYHGCDTFGPTSIALAMRNAPVILDMARTVERVCPEAWLLMFCNPVTMLTDILARYSHVKAIGVCEGAENFLSDWEHLHFEQPVEGLDYRGGGLNHFSWVTRDSTYRGTPVADYLREYLPTIDEDKIAPVCMWPKEKRVFEMTGQMPLNNGHFYHFFFYDEIAEAARRGLERPPAAPPAGPREDPWKRLIEISHRERVENLWDAIGYHRSLGRTDVGVRAICSIHNNLGWTLAVNTPNRGHVVDIPESSVVETTCRLTARGAEPLGLDAVPPMVKGLTQAVSWQQRMVADFAVDPTKKGFIDAIFADPCHRSERSTLAVADKLWEALVKDFPKRKD